MEKKNISWRHHYIPRFYLRGFASDSGTVKIFNVKKGEFIGRGREFSTKAYFFERDVNTIIIDGEQVSDFIEDLYASLDDKMAKILERIQAGNSQDRYGVDEYDMPMIDLFVSLMYWRSPLKRRELEKIFKERSFKELGFRVVDEHGDVKLDVQEELKNDPNFFKGYKLSHALFDVLRGFNVRTPFTILNRPNNLPFVCSDYPIIFNSMGSPKTYSDDYIFPLSGTRVFIKADIKKTIDHFVLFFLVDVIVYKQAENYITCTDEKYILAMDHFFKQKKNIEELKKELFQMLS